MEDVRDRRDDDRETGANGDDRKGELNDLTWLETADLVISPGLSYPCS